MKQWKCTVCGYIHEGDRPPERCPVCGADQYRFILNQELSEELQASLKAAFAGESQAHVRNRAFAAQAEKEGYPQVARLFAAVAEAERVHAAEYLKFLEGVIGSTADNLKRAFENEMKAKDEIYPGLIKQAFDLKRQDAAWSFIRARDVEARHADLYKDALQALMPDREIEYHVCGVCGWVADGPPPENCPVCNSPREEFSAVA